MPWIWTSKYQLACDYWFRKNIDFCLSLIQNKISCKNYSRHVTEVHFKKLELDTEYPSDPITFGTERKIWFLHPLDHRKVQFPKPGKYYIINKSTTFTPFCYPYVKLLNFVSFLQKSQQLFFFQKNQNSGKNQKNHIPA